MQDWLTERVAVSPNALALIIGEEHWTYAQLDGLVNGVYGRLQQEGVQAGDKIGVFMPNCLEYVSVIHALVRLGAVLVPINIRLTEVEAAWQIEHVGCRFVLYTERPDWLMVNRQWLMVNDSWLEPTDFTIHHSQYFDAAQRRFTIHNLQAIVFTSGTSGKPKGVQLTFANHFYSAMASAYRLGVLPDDLWLSCLPLYHVGGLAVIFRSCLYGTAVDLHTRFVLEEVNQALNTKPITLISVVPTMLFRLLETRSFWPDSLRLILLGGAAASAELVTRANNLPRETAVSTPKPLVATTYGMTEAASQVATMLPADVENKPASVGKPLLFTAVKIVDENGAEQPPNQYGEIIVTGPTVMDGYYSPNPSASSGQVSNPQSPIPRSHPSGDIGYIDDDGDLWIVQRRSDLIVSGGENVYPAEVEAVLRTHPAIKQVCVVGVPDAEWGQIVAAMVVLADELETAVTPSDLIQFCRKQLAGYKCPRIIQITAHLPLTASGKIERQKVSEQLKQSNKQE